MSRLWRSRSVHPKEAMYSFHDPDFGLLNFDGSEWMLEHRAVFNGIEIPVRIEPESFETPQLSAVQRQAVQLALALPPDTLMRSAPAVVQNYEVYREMLGDQELPPLQVPSDVWQRVWPSSITIPSHGDVSTPTFLLLAECDWDPEHGLVIRFRDGYADASNQQGELGLED